MAENTWAATSEKISWAMGGSSFQEPSKDALIGAASTHGCCSERPRQQAARRWAQDEIAWGRECLVAGDSVEEIAEAAGCALAEVIANIGPGRLTARQREVVSLYMAGCSFEEIDAERGMTSGRPGSAAAAMVTLLRKRGFPLPYRHGWRRFA